MYKYEDCEYPQDQVSRINDLNLTDDEREAFLVLIELERLDSFFIKFFSRKTIPESNKVQVKPLDIIPELNSQDYVTILTMIESYTKSLIEQLPESQLEAEWLKDVKVYITHHIYVRKKSLLPKD